MTDRLISSIEGHAALSICESLLIAMRDLKLLSEKEARGVLQDAASAHLEESESSSNAVLHEEVAKLITKILANGNSLPRI